MEDNGSFLIEQVTLNASSMRGTVLASEQGWGVRSRLLGVSGFCVLSRWTLSQRWHAVPTRLLFCIFLTRLRANKEKLL